MLRANLERTEGKYIGLSEISEFPFLALSAHKIPTQNPSAIHNAPIYSLLVLAWARFYELRDVSGALQIFFSRYALSRLRIASTVAIKPVPINSSVAGSGTACSWPRISPPGNCEV